MLAELRQGRKAAPACLPNFGRDEKLLRHACRTSAGAKNRSGMLAELRQMIKTIPACLPNFGKGFNNRQNLFFN
ncbi:MAG: hypothetical protein IKG81_04665 [Bacteroidales bacterium]|nr:hypothetical protein [Bacteroidales bacterium]